MSRVLLLAMVCLSGCATYSVRRAALVPNTAPDLRSGLPMEHLMELSIGTPTAAALGHPQAGDDDGLELPRWQGHGAGRLRLMPGLDVGFVWEEGWATGARKLAADQPDVDNGNVHGRGFTVNGGRHLGDNLYLSIDLEILAYEIPYVEYRTCVENCQGVPYSQVERDRTSVPVLSAAVMLAHKNGRLTLFGGLATRNQPTVERGGTESIDVADEDVTAGQFGLSVSAGAELEIAGGLRGLVMVYQTFGTPAVEYPPMIALALTWGFDLPIGGSGPPPASASPPPAP